MRRGHRAAHLGLWLVLAVVIPAVFVAAVALRPSAVPAADTDGAGAP